MLARDLMTPEPVFSLPGDTLLECAREMRDMDAGIIPVVDDTESMRLRGVITDRDLVVRHLAEGCEGCTVADHMTTDGVATVGPETDAGVVTRRMKDARVRRIPVIEDGDRLVGIIAQADLALELGDEDPGTVEELLEALSA